MNKKVAIVTGEVTESRKSTALELAKRGIRIILTCSDKGADALVQEIEQQNAHQSVAFRA